MNGHPYVADAAQRRTHAWFVQVGIDAHALAYQQLTLARATRDALASIGELRIQTNEGASTEAANRHAEHHVKERVAQALGAHHGLAVHVDLVAGTGEVLLCQHGSLGRVATLTAVTADSPLAEILAVAR